MRSVMPMLWPRCAAAGAGSRPTIAQPFSASRRIKERSWFTAYAKRTPQCRRLLRPVREPVSLPLPKATCHGTSIATRSIWNYCSAAIPAEGGQFGTIADPTSHAGRRRPEAVKRSQTLAHPPAHHAIFAIILGTLIGHFPRQTGVVLKTPGRRLHRGGQDNHRAAHLPIIAIGLAGIRTLV